MSSRKKIPLLNRILVDLPAPTNLRFAWSYGSILGLILTFQIIRGLLLRSFYTPRTLHAFDSVIHIQQNVTGGWLLRIIHRTGASIFFILLYIHIGRGLYYSSYRQPLTWISGISLYILSIAVAFIGYLLPWGQISYWGATVITNLFSAIPYIGPNIVSWLWGGFAVREATLGRFFTLHFLIPLIITTIIITHLTFLHHTGSSNPLGTSSVTKGLFHPYYSSKDYLGFLTIIILTALITLYSPQLLRDPENWQPANRLVTPTHIKPEWYFLWVYAILRSIPNKLGGVLVIFSAIFILYLIVYAKPIAPSSFWILARTGLLLRWVGARPVEPPYTLIGVLLTTLYFTIILKHFILTCAR